MARTIPTQRQQDVFVCNSVVGGNQDTEVDLK